MDEQSKCETCGFLALRNGITGFLDEAPQEYRWRAEIPELRNTNVSGFQRGANDFFNHPYNGIPICLARAHPLHNEFANQGQATNSEIFATLERERDCAGRGLFTSWQQGFSPKEHREMLDRQCMLEREDRRDREQIEFQERQEKRTDERHAAQLDQVKGLHTKEMLIVGGFVTLVIVVSTFIGSGIEADWIPKWFGLRN